MIARTYGSGRNALTIGGEAVLFVAFSDPNIFSNSFFTSSRQSIFPSCGFAICDLFATN
jgi:hypothetical protein